MMELLAVWGAINLILPPLGWLWSLRRETRVTTRQRWDDAR